MCRLLILLVFSFSVFAQTMVDMENDIKKSPNHLNTRIQLANLYIKNKQYDKVIALLNAYTDQMPSPGFLALASAYSNLKDYSNEVRVLNLLVDKEDNDFHWHILLGEALLKQASQKNENEHKRDQDTAAIQQFRKALQLQPMYKPAFDILLNTLLQMKANNEAREVINEGINKFGARPELYRELCRLDSNDGFLDQAVINCRQAITLAPNYPDNYVFLVQTLKDQDEEQQAESAAVSAAKKFPRSEFVQWAAGILYFKKKNYPVALRYFQAAVAANPKSGRAQFGLAQAQFESGDESASFEHFVKACEADSTTVDTFLAAGGRLKQKGNATLGEKFVHSAYTCKKST